MTTDAEEDLRRFLTDVARAVPVDATVVALGSMHRGRKLKRRRTALFGAAIAVATGFACVLPGTLSSAIRDPVVASSVFGWEPVGADIADATIRTRAEQAWTSVVGTRRDMSVLFADAVAGTEFAVLEGRSLDGMPRVAVVSGVPGVTPTQRDSPMWLRTEREVSDSDLPYVGIASSHLGPGVGAPSPGTGSVVAFVVTRNEFRVSKFHTAAVDHEMGGSHSDGRWMWANTTSLGYSFTDNFVIEGDGPARAVAADPGIGDPLGVAAQTSPDGRLSVTGAETVQAGEPVVSHNGLAGFVAADGGGWRLAGALGEPGRLTATTDVTFERLQLRATTDGVAVERLAGGSISDGNRVLVSVSDPVPLVLTLGRVQAGLVRPSVGGQDALFVIVGAVPSPRS